MWGGGCEEGALLVWGRDEEEDEGEEVEAGRGEELLQPSANI